MLPPPRAVEVGRVARENPARTAADAAVSNAAKCSRTSCSIFRSRDSVEVVMDLGSHERITN